MQHGIKLILALAIAASSGIANADVPASTPAAADAPAATPAAPAAPAAESPLKTQRDLISYSLGVQTGRNFRKFDSDIDLDLLMRGLRDAMGSERLLMSEKELRAVMGSYMSEVRAKQVANRRVAGDENRKKGEAWLAENGKKEGVVTLASGVQYRILKAGAGNKPQLSDTVMVNYRGTRLDGYEFDATPVGKPAALNVIQLIDGWKEVLQQMPEGSHWQIFIPARHAYGERGAGQDIGPNEAIQFDVELVAIRKPDNAVTTPQATGK